MFELPVVLMYHSVADAIPGTDPFDLHVSPGNFRNQIEALSKVARIISLTELGEDMAGGRTPPDTVALSFDDAYENNLSVAAPILQRAGAPATLFVCPGLLGRQHFWWDRLLETVVTANRIPSGSAGLPAVPASIDALLLRLRAHDSQESRVNLSLGLWQVLQMLDLDDIDAVLAGLREQFEPRSAHGRIRPMRENEVRVAATYFDIGAHSLTHPPMTRLDSTTLFREASESKSACERLAGKPAAGFAYPFGDVNAAVAAEVSRHFAIACTTREAAVCRRTSPWNIPRLHVHDCSADTLLEKIHAVIRTSRMFPPIRYAIQAAADPRKALLRLVEMARIRSANRV